MDDFIEVVQPGDPIIIDEIEYIFGHGSARTMNQILAWFLREEIEKMKLHLYRPNLPIKHGELIPCSKLVAAIEQR